MDMAIGLTKLTGFLRCNSLRFFKGSIHNKHVPNYRLHNDTDTLAQQFLGAHVTVSHNVEWVRRPITPLSICR